VEFSTDADKHLVEPAPRPVSLFSATPVAGGKIELRALWDDTGIAEGVFTAATQVAFYYDNGTGTIDYNTPLATEDLAPNVSGSVSYGGGLKAEYTTGALTDGQEYLFAAKAKTAAGSLSDASSEIAATADATEPDAGTLSAEEII
jgi:hypothetical protein